jgi:broad specificity phosphatase PhoE
MNNLVIYVRHAESVANKIIHNNKHKTLTECQENELNSFLNPNITELGILQAKSTANCLMKNLELLNKDKVTVLVSPYKRTQHTCAYFIDLLNHSKICYNIKIVQELQEYSPPKKSGSPNFITHYSMDEFIDQVLKFNEILKFELATSDTIIIFGHSLFFSSLIAYHVSHEKHRPSEMPSFQLPNCSISCENYDLTNKIWRTYMTSNISHLSKDIVTGNHSSFDII